MAASTGSGHRAAWSLATKVACHDGVFRNSQILRAGEERYVDYGTSGSPVFVSHCAPGLGKLGLLLFARRGHVVADIAGDLDPSGLTGARRALEGATVSPGTRPVHALDINRDVMLAIRNVDACLALTRAPSRTWTSTRAKTRARQTAPSGTCPSTAWKRLKIMEKPNDHRVSIATALVALYVGAGGIAKLLGVPYVHSSFPKLGLPVWFGYFIGVCEVLGSIGLLVAPLSALAAMGIGIIMVGATYYHATYTPVFQAAPAFILTILCAYIFLKRRVDILKFS
jgi:putative oxidoreductase